MKVLFVGLCLVYLSFFADGQYYACSGPCVPDFPTCQDSVCDTANGVCITTLKNPLPSGCCETNAQCRSSDPCLIGSCSLLNNECVYERICGTDEDKPCVQTRDCTDNTNPCSVELCIDGFCRTSSIPDTNNPNCCLVPSDCAKFPCKIVSCPESTYTCSYRVNTTCEDQQNYEPIGYEEDYSSPSSSLVYTQYSQEPYVVGDYIFAIIGIIILVCLVCIFCIVLGIVCIQNRRQQL